MADTDLIGQLQELGFTEYQARTYVAAVQRGAAEAKELSETSGVPQSRIYDVIADLRETGLIEIREASGAKTIVATPPSRSLEALKERRVMRLTDAIDSVATELEQVHQPERHPSPFVTMVGLRKTALRHIGLAIESADWWLSLALPYDLYREVEAEVDAAIERGVNVRLVVPESAETPSSAVSFPEGMAVRERLLADVLAIADRGYGVFSSLTVGDESPYVVMQDRHLVFLLQNFFEHFWPVSSIVKPVTRFPRRYLDPWRTIKDLKSDLDADVDYGVTVTGYHNTLQENGTWEGQIVDYELYGPIEADYTIALPTKANLFVDIDGEVAGVGGPRAARMDIAADGIEVTGPAT